jgi:EmrB/QacA subfamily drug resistance transporter
MPCVAAASALENGTSAPGKDTMPTTLSSSPQSSPGGHRAGLSLLVVATAQLMLVLDDTVANIALPSIQRELAVSAAALPWVISAYVLAFGSLLLFGGRAGDVFGRRRVLRIGLGVFTLASLLGGLGPSAAWLIVARALQGVGAALVAPNVLALIATTFPAGKPRNQAMGVYAAMSAVGMTVGVLLGGVLTGTLGWRWVFLINIPIGLAVLAGTRALVEAPRHPGQLRVLDALSGTVALVALAFGITRGGEHGWGDAVTAGALALAAVLLGVFLSQQARRQDPMLPLALFRDRSRSGAYASVLLIGGGLMAAYFLLTQLMQQVLAFSPIRTGLASLPVAAGIVVAAGISSKLVERLPARAVSVPGLLLAAAGMAWLSTLGPGASYGGHVLPALFLTYFGLGMGFMPMTLVAVQGVAPAQTGVASAVLNTAQQLGAALGVAVLSTVATTRSDGRLPGAAGALEQALMAGDQASVAAARDALTGGYGAGFATGAALLLVGALVVAVTVRTRRTGSGAPVQGAEGVVAA